MPPLTYFSGRNQYAPETTRLISLIIGLGSRTAVRKVATAGNSPKLQADRQCISQCPGLVGSFEDDDLGDHAQPGFGGLGGFERGEGACAEVFVEVAGAVAGQAGKLGCGESGAVH